MSGAQTQEAEALAVLLSVLPRVNFRLIEIEHNRWRDGQPSLTLAEIEENFNRCLSEAFEEAGGSIETTSDLRARVARYDHLITQAIDAEVSFETVDDVRTFLLYGLPGCRE